MHIHSYMSMHVCTCHFERHETHACHGQYIYVHTYIHANIHMHISTHIHRHRVNTHTHTQIHMHIHTHTHVLIRNIFMRILYTCTYTLARAGCDCAHTRTLVGLQTHEETPNARGDQQDARDTRARGPHPHALVALSTRVCPVMPCHSDKE
jgi:hypothetical protein